MTHLPHKEQAVRIKEYAKQLEYDQKLIISLLNERSYQQEKWGTEFDDKNTLNDWVTYIVRYAGNAAEMGMTPETQREQLRKVAALAIAAIETFDRNGGFPPRHYDEAEE